MARLTFLLLFLMCSCQPSQRANAGWQKVFQNDADGNAVFGEKSKVIDAVRSGYPIRIGWGSSRVEHVTDADFLTIFQGKEVFAQIRSIVGQAPKITNDSMQIAFRKENQWTKIAGTNGFSSNFMKHTLPDTIVNTERTGYGSTTWYVLYPNHQLDIEARPLWSEKSPNWELWNKNKNN